MNIVVDKFEKDSVIVELENREKVKVPRQIIPVEAVEGTILTIAIDREKTEKFNAGIDRLIKDIWKN